MEIFFSHPLKITLNMVAEIMELSIENVEYFLMKSLLVHLIEGMVDQTDGMIHVSWGNLESWNTMVKSLQGPPNTFEKAHTALLYVEAEKYSISWHFDSDISLLLSINHGNL